jgi:hypothetical protein
MLLLAVNLVMTKHLKLCVSFFIVFLLLVMYTVYALLTDPFGRHPVGHWLDIFGLLFMVMTETLYSLRGCHPAGRDLEREDEDDRGTMAIATKFNIEG